MWIPAPVPARGSGSAPPRARFCSHSGSRPCTSGSLGEVALRRRRRNRPLQRGAVPRIGRRVPRRRACVLMMLIEEDQEREAQDERARGLDLVQRSRSPSSFGIGVDPARHAGQPEEVHREEGQVEADRTSARSAACPAARPASGRTSSATSSRSPAKRREDAAAEEHVVEVRDDEVGVVLLQVDRRRGVHDAGEAADGEHARRSRPRRASAS